MDHIAIDVGGRKSFVCVRSEGGEILESKSVETDALGRFLRKREKSRVLMETCAESFSIADEALRLGHDVRVIPSAKVRVLGVGHHGIKTDRRDAEVLSEVSTRINLKGVHIPSAQARELKAKLSARDALVGCKVALINNCRGILRGQRIRIRASTAKSFVKAVRSKFAGRGLATPVELDRSLTCILALAEQIREADLELAEFSKSHEICRRLRSVPGVGSVTSVAYLATIDEVQRFEGAHALESYVGVVPGEDSSSDRVRRTAITKAGPQRLRRLLVQAAWVALLRRPSDPMVQWARRIAIKRGKNVAVVALARKLAGILFAMWRDGTDYDPCCGAARPPTDTPTMN
jgi:transposase